MQSMKLLRLVVVFKLIGGFNIDPVVVSASLGLVGFYNFKNDPLTIVAHFAEGGENFLIYGTSTEDKRYQFDAVVNVKFYNTFFIGLSYSHHWKENFSGNGVTAKLRYDF